MISKVCSAHDFFMSVKYKIFLQVITISVILAGTTDIFSFDEIDSSFKPVFMGGGRVVTSINQRPDGKIVVSGGFLVAGGERKNSVALLNTDGTADTSFDIGKGPSNTFGGDDGIFSNAVQSDNKILICGNFNRVNNFVRNGLARLNADGTVDTSFDVGGGFNSSVVIVKALSNGKILVGGYFFTFNSQQVGSLVRLNPDGTLDNSFSTMVNAAAVLDIAIQPDGKIIVVGAIFNIGGTIRRNIARLNEDGTLDPTFDPGTGTTSNINSVKLQPDGKVLIGGTFATFNGMSQRGVARLNADGSLDNSFTANINVGGVFPRVHSLSIQADGKIIIGGNFTNVNSVNRTRIARVNSDGSLDVAFNPSVESNDGSHTVYTMSLLPNETIVIGGHFSTVNELFRPAIAALNNDGTLAGSFDQGAGDIAQFGEIIKQPDGKIIAAAGFSHVNGLFRQGITRLNSDGSIDSSFNPGTGAAGTVQAVALQTDGKIIIGGRVNSYNGTFRGNITRINPDGSLDTSFPQGVTLNDFVLDIVIQDDNKIIVGGSFGTGIVRLNANGTRDTSFNAGTGISGEVQSVVIQPDGKIIVAGGFSNYNGNSRNGIARLNPDGSIDNTFNPSSGANGTVYGVALQKDGKIIAVGEFSTFNGTNRNRIVRLNADGSLDLSFDPGVGVDGRVNTVLLQPDGKIFIGGNFNNYNSVSRDRLARILPNGSLDSTFGSNLDFFYKDQLEIGPRIYSLALEDNNLLVAGLFSEINEMKRASLARFSNVINTSPQTPFDFDGDGKSDISVFRPSTSAWYLLQSQSGFSGVQFGVPTDKIVPADFDGDGKTDIAVFRAGNWYWLNSSNGQFNAVQFGTNEDLPRPGDFDRDGKADIAVFRPSNGTWYWLSSSNNQFNGVHFGAVGDVPLVADFDGDGKSDLTVFRPSTGSWYWLNSSNGQFNAVQFGTNEDLPTVGDFDGDGKTDISVFRPSNGTWYRLNSSNGQFVGIQFGVSGDVPTVGDFDGDGESDIAVFRPSNGNWYLLNSQSGFTAVRFGVNEDKPIPAAFQ